MIRYGMALLLLGLWGCSTSEPVDPESAADAGVFSRGTVTLRVGESVEIPGGGPGIRLVDVADDSRCPVDVTCVWEGDAVAGLEIQDDGEIRGVELHLTARDATGPGHVDVGGYRVAFDGLTPEAREGVAIPQGDYRVTLRVTAAP
jgi:hypothetical protein